MVRDKESLMTISEMAHLCRTTKDTLYFYEKRGYLKPRFVDTNGYRYYDRNNFYSIDMFLSLREAGSSVDEIGRYLEDPSPESYIYHLKAKRNDLRSKIQDLLTLEGRISESIALTQEGVFRKPDEIFEEYMPAQFLLCRYCEDHDDPKKSAECFMSVLNSSKELNIPYDFHLSAFISKERFLSGNFNPDYYYAASSVEITSDDVRKKPAGKYISLIHQGAYNDSIKHYPDMIKYIEAKGYIIAGDVYEQTLIGWLNSTSDSQYRTKLSIPIIEP